MNAENYPIATVHAYDTATGEELLPLRRYFILRDRDRAIARKDRYVDELRAHAEEQGYFVMEVLPLPLV